MLMEFIYLCGVSENIGANFVMYADFFKHYGNLLLPFICAGSMPELRVKIRKMFPCWRRPMRVVRPEILPLPRRKDVLKVKTTTAV
jgi:hypothetical protein